MTSARAWSPLKHGQGAMPVQRGRQVQGVAARAQERDAGGEQRLGRLVLPLPRQHNAQPDLDTTPVISGSHLGLRQRPLQPGAAFAQVAPARPEPGEQCRPGGRSGHRTFGIEPLQGGAHIGVLGLELVEWTLLCPSRPAQHLDQVRAIVRVRYARGRLLAAGRELLQGELADRLQHPEARTDLGGRCAHRPHEALVHQCGDERESWTGGAARSSRRHRLRGFEGESPGEDTQPPKQPLLLGLEQLVTPGDRVPHRPLPVRQIGGASGQQRQARRELLGQRFRRAAP